MNMEFLVDFISFLKRNNINIKIGYSTLIFIDGNNNEVATIEDDKMSLPMNNVSNASDEFISMLVDYKAKIELVKDKKYNLNDGFAFKIDDETVFTIPNEDNKIEINL